MISDGSLKDLISQYYFSIFDLKMSFGKTDKKKNPNRIDPKCLNSSRCTAGASL